MWQLLFWMIGELLPWGVVALHHSDIDLELLQLLDSDTLQQRAAYAAAQLVYNSSPQTHHTAAGK